MNFKKVMAGSLASIMAVSSLAVAASAKGYTPTDEEKEKYQPWCTAGENWMITIHEDGDPDTGKEEIDFGVDPTSIDSFTIYLDVVKNPDPRLGVLELDKFQSQINDYFDGDPNTRGDFMYNFAGSVIYAANSGDFGSEGELYDKYNWPNSEFWSIPAKGDTIEGRYDNDVVEGLPAGDNSNRGQVAYNKKLHIDYVDDFRYSITYDVANLEGGIYKWPAQGEGTTAGLYRIGFQEWSNVTAFVLRPSLLVCRDSNGDVILAFDGYGNVVDNDEATKMADEMNALTEEAANYTPAAAETTAADTEAPADDAADTEAAASTTTAAPASSSNSSSGPNIGLIIGIVAAVVIIAVIVVIVIKKKK
ncbi:MAG: hypothetical protein NC203_10525 [Firmicutes bacterium]|nr:hypothetical protein [[Eubacterium] siraeum]MCM1488787.1 hypothetical protein [Bacillota bacterium]